MLNVPHMLNLNTKGLICDVQVIFGLFFSRGSFLPFKFIFCFSCFFILFVFFFSSWWSLTHEIKAILYTSSPISNWLSYDSLRYCCITYFCFLPYGIFCSTIHIFLILDLGVAWKSSLNMKLAKDFPVLEAELGKAATSFVSNISSGAWLELCFPYLNCLYFDISYGKYQKLTCITPYNWLRRSLTQSPNFQLLAFITSMHLKSRFELIQSEGVITIISIYARCLFPFNW